MPAVGTYNSVTLGVNTPVQLTPPGSGYVFYILNTITGGKLYISNLNTAGNNATSFMLPANLYSPGLSGNAALWIASDTAGNVSVYCGAAR